MNKKFILTSILAITFAMPVMAEIESGATCDTTNLGQSENNSTANVEADWTANTININWYNGDNVVSTNTCTYDGTITLPTEPTKTGYTFAGWRLRQAVQVERTIVANCTQIDNESDCNNAKENACPVDPSPIYRDCMWESDTGTCGNGGIGILCLLS